MAMAYVKGETLEELVAREGPLTEKVALQIARSVASALQYCWQEHRILHRDIKPANIMLDQYGSVRVMDMGISKMIGTKSELTLDDTILGTPNYMSPEQIEDSRRVDVRADMYSLGATLYFALTGQVPFKGASIAETLHKQIEGGLPDPRIYAPKLSEPCVSLLEVMLARSPEARHPDWHSLINDIQRVETGKRPLHTLPKKAKSVMRRRSADKRAPAAPRPHLVHPVNGGQGARPKRPSTAHCLFLHQERTSPLSTILGVFWLLVLGGGVVAFYVAARSWQEREERLAALRTAELQRKQREEMARKAEAERAKAELEKQVEAARQFADSHPDDPAAALGRFQELAAKVTGTPFEGEIRSRITTLKQELVTREIKDVRQRLLTEARALAEAGKQEQAIEMLNSYTGPHAEATREERLALAAEITKALVQQKEAEARRREEERKLAEARLDALLNELADQLLRFDFAAAERRAADAEQDESLRPLATVRDEICRVARAVAKLPAMVLSSYDRDRGLEIAVGLKRGTETLQILGVEGGRVQAAKIQRPGWGVAVAVPAPFTYEDLTPAEKLARLGSLPGLERDIMRGLLSVEAGTLEKARKFFQAAASPLARALDEKVARRTPATPAAGTGEVPR
ncbi:MAG: protein kinase, partial [Kiritimatiellae bacterium]|nr:protein kinase [Kiritimatiellia bacterium]